MAMGRGEGHGADWDGGGEGGPVGVHHVVVIGRARLAVDICGIFTARHNIGRGRTWVVRNGQAIVTGECDEVGVGDVGVCSRSDDARARTCSAHRTSTSE